jgi:hypothetical protein
VFKDSSQLDAKERHYVTSSNVEPADDITSFPILARLK